MAKEQRKSILVVDDDEHALIVLEALLENTGYDTTTAWSEQSALELLRSRKFDLVLLDDFLPDCREGFLTQMERLGIRTPVVVMQSTQPTLHATVRFASLGASDVVSKWSLGELLKAIGSCLFPSSGCRANG